MLRIVDYIIKFSCLMLFSLGLWLIVSPWIMTSVKSRVYNSRFKRDAQEAKEMRVSKSLFINHINRLLDVTTKKIKIKAQTFIFFSLSLFICTFWLLYQNTVSVFYVIVLSGAIALLPYLLLIVRLHSMRIEGSYEGEAIVTELINQYKLNNMNMVEAIEKTSVAAKHIKYSQKALFRMSFGIKECRRHEDIEEVIKTFVFAFDTEWSVQLGMNMEIAITDGTNVSTSLDDILGELQQVRETLEKQKRDNNESFSMIRYILLPTYLISVIFAIRYFGFTIEKFFSYQFHTDIGLKFAVVLFPSIIICFIILLINKKPKYDI